MMRIGTLFVLLSTLLLAAPAQAQAEEIVHEDDKVIVYLLPQGQPSAPAAEKAAKKILTSLVGKGVQHIAKETLSAAAGSLAGALFSVVSEMPTVGNATRTELTLLSGGRVVKQLAVGQAFTPLIVSRPGDTMGAGVRIGVERGTSKTRLGIFKTTQWRLVESSSLMSERAFDAMEAQVHKARKAPGVLPARGFYLIVPKQSLRLREAGRYRVTAIARSMYGKASQAVKVGQGTELQGRAAVILRFELPFDIAVKRGVIPPEANRQEILAHSVGVIRNRLKALGLRVRVKAAGEQHIEVSLSSGGAALEKGVISIVTQLGHLKFRIVVRTDAAYDANGDDNGDKRVRRRGVWHDPKPNSLATWKAAEITRWKLASAKGQVYLPSDKRYSLVKAAGKDGSSADHFHVLEEVNLPYAFGGGILENPTVSQNHMGWPVVLFDVRDQYQNKFAQWTKRNIGLPMAIVLNDEFYSAPIIRDTLTSSVQISLGSGPRQAQLREAKEMAAVLRTGALKVRPELVAVRRSPVAAPK